MLTAITRLATGSTLLLALVGCPGGSDASVTSVMIDGGDRTLPQDTTHTLTATVQSTGNAPQTVTWNSDDTNVATIDNDGTVHTDQSGPTVITATSTTDPTKTDTITITVKPPGTRAWTRLFGTSDVDFASAIGTDANGNVYVAGYTNGALEGLNAGSVDAFVRSYDGSGNLRWTRQFGTANIDTTNGIAIDASGNIFVVGTTEGALDGSNAGGRDAFVRAYSGDGDLRWGHQFGTSSDDVASAIATDDGNVYATGNTRGAIEGNNAGGTDVFIRGYDSNGNFQWTRQFGTSGEDDASGISTDTSGNAFVVGNTVGNLAGTNAGGRDAFLRSYDGNGDLRLTRQFGTSNNDFASSVTTGPNGAVYIAGYSEGALGGPNAGDGDAFIRTYDSDGTLRWTRQFGTSSNDDTVGVAADANGNIVATGTTQGALDGTSAGGADAFIRSYAADGTVRWTRQVGSINDENTDGLATDPNGFAYITGTTFGVFDVFVHAYVP